MPQSNLTLNIHEINDIIALKMYLWVLKWWHEGDLL